MYTKLTSPLRISEAKTKSVANGHAALSAKGAVKVGFWAQANARNSGSKSGINREPRCRVHGLVCQAAGGGWHGGGTWKEWMEGDELRSAAAALRHPTRRPAVRWQAPPCAFACRLPSRLRHEKTAAASSASLQRHFLHSGTHTAVRWPRWAEYEGDSVGH